MAASSRLSCNSRRFVVAKSVSCGYVAEPSDPRTWALEYERPASLEFARSSKCTSDQYNWIAYSRGNGYTFDDTWVNPTGAVKIVQIVKTVKDAIQKMSTEARMAKRGACSPLRALQAPTGHTNIVECLSPREKSIYKAQKNPSNQFFFVSQSQVR